MTFLPETASLALLILACAFVTYLTRIGGHLMLLRLKRIPPRAEAALQAVPAAVLATLVFPPALTKGPVEAITMALAILLCLRFSPIVVLLTGLAFLVAGRTVFYAG